MPIQRENHVALKDIHVFKKLVIVAIGISTSACSMSFDLGCKPPSGDATYSLQITERDGGTCHLGSIPDQTFRDGTFVGDATCRAKGDLTGDRCSIAFENVCQDLTSKEELDWLDGWAYATGTIEYSGSCSSVYDVILSRK